MKSMKRILSIPLVQRSLGVAAAGYLRTVWKTSRFGVDPSDLYDRIALELPVIVTMWHGQDLMMPFLKRKEHAVKVLISRHRDGEVMAIAAEHLGLGVIRGSGSRGSDFIRKGAITGFRQMVTALEQGYNVALTADIPKVARVAGHGIVHLARISGRPIFPVAVATSHYIELNNWDHSVINLPFGRFIIVAGELVRVAANADDVMLEDARRLVESRLNETTERAYAVAGKRAKDFEWSQRPYKRHPRSAHVWRTQPPLNNSH